MKRRNIQIRFLLLISILMLGIGMIPHHHHSHKAAPCFHAYENPGASASDEMPADRLHRCSCLDSFYAAQTPGHLHSEPYCNHFPSVDLLADLLTCFLLIPGRIVRVIRPVYRNPLHDAPVLCASGLRAPPLCA